jgi:hypothetical protein
LRKACEFDKDLDPEAAVAALMRAVRGMIAAPLAADARARTALAIPKSP